MDRPEELAAAITASERQTEWLRDLRDSDIRRRLAEAESQSDIARRYAVAPSHPDRIAKQMVVQTRAADHRQGELE